MLNQLADWLDDRTGYRTLIRTFNDEQIPGGARWRYVFGSTLASVFLIQAFTGVLMMTAYSPSSSSAWGSVYYINNVMWMGWFIRGLHHFGASTVMVLLVTAPASGAAGRRLPQAARGQLVVRPGAPGADGELRATPATSFPGTRRATGRPRS